MKFIITSIILTFISFCVFAQQNINEKPNNTDNTIWVKKAVYSIDKHSDLTQPDSVWVELKTKKPIEKYYQSADKKNSVPSNFEKSGICIPYDKRNKPSKEITNKRNQ